MTGPECPLSTPLKSECEATDCTSADGTPAALRCELVVIVLEADSVARFAPRFGAVFEIDGFEDVEAEPAPSS